MKYSVFLILLLFPSGVIYSQKDSIQENYLEINFPVLLYPMDITSNKTFLFSDSIYKKPYYLNIPGSVLIQESSFEENPIHVTSKSYFPPTLQVNSINHSETFIFYHLGSANSQYLQLKHVQRINSNISAIATYNRDKSDGFYVHHAGKTELFDFQLTYQNDGRSYSLTPYFHYKNQIQQENGGIKSDSIFSSGDFTSSLILETNSLTAQNSKSAINTGISQIFTSKNQNFQIRSNLGTHLQKREFEYDPTEGMYDSIYYDSTLTLDKYESNRFYHELSLIKAFQKFIPKIGLRNEYMNYTQRSIDTSSFENKIFINSELNFNKNKLNLCFDYNVTGYNQNNYSGKLIYSRNHHSLFSVITSSHSYTTKNADIFYSLLDGNHFRWNNSLNQINALNNDLNLKSKYGDLKLFHELSNNFVYLNENKEVTQTSEKLQWFKINYAYKFEKKKIFWRTDVIYQHVLSGENFYRIPDLIIRSDFRFKTKLKALQMQIGLTADYRTEYFANGYDPALGEFYLQNDFKSGNYPIFDFYIFSKVKTVDFKLTLSHFNSGFTGYNYYSTPLYPIAPRAFHFSISWHFID